MKNKTPVLPIVLGLAGAGIATIIVIIIVKKLKNIQDERDWEVENYDIVHNKPLYRSFLRASRK